MMSGARSCWNRVVAPVMVAGALVLGVWGVPRVGFGQKANANEPEVDLLKAQPFDRLTLADGKVYLIEPVNPRPLPPVETKEKEKPGRKKKAKVNEAVGIPGEEIKEQAKDVVEE